MTGIRAQPSSSSGAHSIPTYHSGCYPFIVTLNTTVQEMTFTWWPFGLNKIRKLTKIVLIHLLVFAESFVKTTHLRTFCREIAATVENSTTCLSLRLSHGNTKYQTAKLNTLLPKSTVIKSAWDLHTGPKQRQRKLCLNYSWLCWWLQVYFRLWWKFRLTILPATNWGMSISFIAGGQDLI